MSYSAIALLRALVDRVVVADEAAGVGRAVVVGEDEVVGERERQDQPEAVAVGRHVADAQPRAAGAGAAAGHVLAVERHRPAGRLAQPDDRLDELVLAVAGDAGDAEDLAGPDLEVDAADDLAAAVVARPGGPSTLSTASPGCDSPRSTVELDVATDHQLGEVLLVGLGRDPLRPRPCRAG